MCGARRLMVSHLKVSEKEVRDLAGNVSNIMNDAITLTVCEGERRNGVFDCRIDGRYLCSSPSPFIDGARHLLARGYDPAARVVMRHAGSTSDALYGILDRVALNAPYAASPELWQQIASDLRGQPTSKT